MNQMNIGWNWNGQKWKTRKIMIPSLFLAILAIVSVCEGKKKMEKEKQQKRKKEKNTDKIQTKLNVPSVRHDVKILPQ